MPARKKSTTVKTKVTSYTLAQIVEKFGGEVLGDARVRISRVATLESAHTGDISFVTNPRYLSQLATSQASAIIIGNAGRDATTLPRIVSDNPYAYFAKVSTLLNPMPALKAGIHRTAVVDRTAKIAKGASIAANVVIGARVKIGARAVIGAGCVIGDDVEIGADTRLYPRVTIYHKCILGERVIVHSGVVIGADGFGIANENGKWIHIPQIGRVLIGDDVEIGANTTIDRGALDDTVIEEGVKLDNQIQIGHNVRIGAHTAIAACTGIAGSAKIGKYCIIGGAAQISGHITLADHVNVSGGTPIIKSLDKPGVYTGVFPTTDHEHWIKNAAQLRHLDKLVERIKSVEHALKREEEK